MLFRSHDAPCIAATGASSAPAVTDPDGDGESVGDATGLAGAAVGLIGAGEEVGPADDDEAAGDGVEVASSWIAPAGPAVVDEHPATAAVTSTNPTVRSFIRILIACSTL